MRKIKNKPGGPSGLLYRWTTHFECAKIELRIFSRMQPISSYRSSVGKGIEHMTIIRSDRNDKRG
jgi:hypothetical protein